MFSQAGPSGHMAPPMPLYHISSYGYQQAPMNAPHHRSIFSYGTQPVQAVRAQQASTQIAGQQTHISQPSFGGPVQDQPHAGQGFCSQLQPDNSWPSSDGHLGFRPMGNRDPSLCLQSPSLTPEEEEAQCKLLCCKLSRA